MFYVYVVAAMILLLAFFGYMVRIDAHRAERGVVQLKKMASRIHALEKEDGWTVSVYEHTNAYGSHVGITAKSDDRHVYLGYSKYLLSGGIQPGSILRIKDKGSKVRMSAIAETANDVLEDYLLSCGKSNNQVLEAA